MKKILFKEKARFDDKFVLYFMIIGIAASVIGLVYGFFTKSITNSQILGLSLALVLLIGQLWWLNRIKLKVSINKTRIKFKMFPYHNKSQKIEWDNIENVEIVSTKDSSYWQGVNTIFTEANWFSISGKNGIKVTTKDGEKYFIGCKDTDELQKSLSHLSNDSTAVA